MYTSTQETQIQYVYEQYRQHIDQRIPAILETSKAKILFLQH
jgi:hypothetical protein